MHTIKSTSRSTVVPMVADNDYVGFDVRSKDWREHFAVGAVTRVLSCQCDFDDVTIPRYRHAPGNPVSGLEQSIGSNNDPVDSHR